MPMQTGQNQLTALLPSLRKVHEQHKGKEVSQDSGGQLPADVNGGVAQLKTCRISKVKEGGKNAGKLQFYADAVMKEPKATESGQPVRGLLTRVIIPIYDTPERTVKTAADHFGAVQDLVSRLLGHKSITDDVSPDNIEASMAALVQQKPHFGVRTWKGNKQDLRRIDGKFYLVNVDKNGDQVGNPLRGPWSNEQVARAACPYAGREPRVNEVWQAAVDYQDNGQAVSGSVDDETAPVDASGEASADGEASQGEQLEDLVVLVKEASGDNDGSEAAQMALTSLAERLGVSAEDINDARDWEAVANLIRAAQGTEPGVLDDVERGGSPPEMNSICQFRPLVFDPKSKRKVRSKKPVDCKVLSVNKDDRTVELKDMTKPKVVYKDVSWDDLEPVEDR